MKQESRAAQAVERLLGARTFLFVPGDQPDKLRKAYGSLADALVVDLEDAVQPSRRVFAREEALRWLSDLPERGNPPAVLVRVNAADSADHQADLRALLASRIDGIVLPKFGTEDAYRACTEISPVPVVAIVETARGLLEIARTSSLPANVCRLAFGAGDFSADIGVAWEKSNPSVLAARCQLVWSSTALALTAPIDTAFPWLDDKVGLVEEATMAAAIGYSGKFCIHPAQLDAVVSAMTPSADEHAWAERVIALWSEHSTNGKGAFRLDNAMVDEAVVKRARRVLSHVNMRRPTGEG